MSKRIERRGADLENFIQGQAVALLRKLPKVAQRRRVATWLAQAMQDDDTPERVEAPSAQLVSPAAVGDGVTAIGSEAGPLQTRQSTAAGAPFS